MAAVDLLPRPPQALTPTLHLRFPCGSGGQGVQFLVFVCRDRAQRLLWGTLGARAGFWEQGRGLGLSPDLSLVQGCSF